MKTETFERKDGTQGQSHKPEVGDEVLAKFDKVGERENAIVKDGKAIIIKNYFLGVVHDDVEKTIVITGGQKKVLDKEGDLTDKKIKFVEYDHKEFGKQVGVRVVK